MCLARRTLNPVCSWLWSPVSELWPNQLDRLLAGDSAQPRHRSDLRVTQKLRFRLPPLPPAQKPTRTEALALGFEDALIPVHLGDHEQGEPDELRNPPALAQVASVLFPGVPDGRWELGCDLLADVRRDAPAIGGGL